MEFQRGERVNLNFDTGAVEKLEPDHVSEPSFPSFPTFVGDIQERDSSIASPPVAPSLKPNVNGFPAHKKRTPRVSAFKQQRAAKEQAAKAPVQHEHVPRAPASGVDQEKQSIDEENRQRLAAMSDEEIEQERQELMQSLNPALLQRLLARSDINQGSNEQDFGQQEASTAPATEVVEAEPQAAEPMSTKKASFSTAGPTHDAPSSPSTALPISDPTKPSEPTPQDPTDSIHFPQPPQPPDLDPSDPNFLANLHTKYFPSLPYDPSHLHWMTPIDPTDTTSAYHPSHTSFTASDLRFDFTGALLAPRLARTLPTSKGLHHHAAAPEAAGYTIPELSVTARSAVAAQRCVAYQTLGRILYRLGRGEFGVETTRREEDGPVRVVRNPVAEGQEGREEEDDGGGSAMAAGLWACVEQGRVIETLTEEANRDKGHLSARTFAQEALWNWRRGGGRKRAAV